MEETSKNNETAQLGIGGVSNRVLWRIEPYFDGISTAVTTYKVVDQNGTLQYMGDRNQCEYFLQHGWLLTDECSTSKGLRSANLSNHTGQQAGYNASNLQ